MSYGIKVFNSSGVPKILTSYSLFTFHSRHALTMSGGQTHAFIIPEYVPGSFTFEVWTSYKNNIPGSYGMVITEEAGLITVYCNLPTYVTNFTVVLTVLSL